MGRRRSLVCAQKQAIDLFPVRIGQGIDYSLQKYNLTPGPTARVILVGTGTNSGQVEYQATEALAVARMRGTGGDWMLWPDNTTAAISSPSTLIRGNSAFPGGSSTAFPAVFGTYDATDPYNFAKYNKGPMHFFDLRGVTTASLGSNGVFYNTQPCDGQIWINLGWIHDSNTATYGIKTLNFLGNINRFVIDSCYIFAGNTTIQGFAVGNINAFGIRSAANALQVILTSSGNTATCTTFDAAGVAIASQAQVGQTCKIANADGATTAYNGIYTVTSTPTSNSFTYTFAGTGGVAATSTSPKFLSYGLALAQAPDSSFACDWHITGCALSYGQGANQGNMYLSQGRRNNTSNTMFHHGGWMLGQSRAGVGTDPPDINVLRHNGYYTETNDTIKFVRNWTSWDAINFKMTGSTIDYRDNISVRDPIPVIIDCVGNDGASNIPNGCANSLTPLGGNFKCTGLLMVNTDDAAYSGAGTLPRGWGPLVVTSKAGSVIAGNICLNNGDQPNTSDMRGYGIGANGQPIPTTMNAISNLLLNWTSQDYSAQANTARTDDWNVSAAANTGTNLNQADASLSTLQTGWNNSLARNLHTTFRLADPDLAANITPVTGGSTYNNNKGTEELCLIYISQNWKKKRWSEDFRRHMQRPMGR